MAGNPAHNPVTVRKPYLVAGVVMGVLWFVNGGEPLWAHALKMLVSARWHTGTSHALPRPRGPEATHPFSL